MRAGKDEEEAYSMDGPKLLEATANICRMPFYLARYHLHDKAHFVQITAKVVNSKEAMQEDQKAYHCCMKCLTLSPQ